jgi:hypothetical protein
MNMIIDKQCEFSSEQRVCDAGATEASENYFDTQIAAPVLGKGVPVKILFTVEEVFAGAATTLTVTLQESSDNAVADAYADVPGASTGAIAKALLVAGYQFVMMVPPIATERYLQLLYTGDNTFETTGKISAQVVLDQQTNLGGY